jgi:hypothetical protein
MIPAAGKPSRRAYYPATSGPVAASGKNSKETYLKRRRNAGFVSSPFAAAGRTPRRGQALRIRAKSKQGDLAE